MQGHADYPPAVLAPDLPPLVIRYRLFGVPAVLVLVLPVEASSLLASFWDGQGAGSRRRRSGGRDHAGLPRSARAAMARRHELCIVAPRERQQIDRKRTHYKVRVVAARHPFEQLHGAANAEGYEVDDRDRRLVRASPRQRAGRRCPASDGREPSVDYTSPSSTSWRRLSTAQALWATGPFGPLESCRKEYRGKASRRRFRSQVASSSRQQGVPGPAREKSEDLHFEESRRLPLPTSDQVGVRDRHSHSASALQERSEL